MPLVLMPVMISWAACSRSVSACNFWSTQLVGGAVGVSLGVGVWLGVGVVGVSVGSIGVTGTESDGGVLGPAVGELSLQALSRSAAAASAEVSLRAAAADLVSVSPRWRCHTRRPSAWPGPRR